MRTRKEMKASARKVLCSHYAILLAACLMATFIGSEFGGSLKFITAYREDVSSQDTDEIIVGEGMQEAVLSAVTGDLESGIRISNDLTNRAVTNTKEGKGNKALGRSRGFLAGMINEVESGGVFISIISGMRFINLSKNATMVLFLLLAMAFLLFIWIFLINMFRAVIRRVFLESRIYDKISPQRFLVFWRVRRWKNVSIVMFMTSVFYYLWCLTVVGGFIKHFSYYLVPYIAAENPDISWRDAIRLSRTMMKGHKWECFVFELTFLPWRILGFFTLGAVNTFFTNPYRVATFSEYYAELRNMAGKEKPEGYKLMNDRYLFQKAGEEELLAAYIDIAALKSIPDERAPENGVKGFIAKVFGITLFACEDEARYEASEERKQKINLFNDALEGKAYPERLFPIPENKKNSRVETIHYLRRYSIPNLIFLFFVFSFVGWLWEVSLRLIVDGALINRGVLHGPWLPIYGMGGTLILVLLHKLRKKPVLEFFGTVALCGVVEYFASYALEVTQNGMKWWDYSGYFLNLNGRICAEGLLVFGLGGIAIVYFIAPLVDNHLRKIRYKAAIPICIVLLLVFCSDFVYSIMNPNAGKGITDYKGAYIERSWEENV